MSADAVCGAAYGERSGERVNTRNGYRQRPWDTRAGSIEWRSRSYVRAATSPAGCWNGAAGRRRRWSASSPRPICWASRPGGWRSWSRPWASPGYRNRRSVRWPETSMPRWRRSGVQVGALLVHSGALSRVGPLSGLPGTPDGAHLHQLGARMPFLVASVPNPVFNHVAGLTAQNVGALPELAHWYGASGLPLRVDVTPAQAMTARARVLQGGP
jgi:hypothetical protein